MKTSIQPMKAVYSFYFPEVRNIISEVTANYPHHTFIEKGTTDLESFHEPVIEAYIRHYKDQLPTLHEFPYQYISSGSSEVLFHILSHIAAYRREVPLYTLEGEYEGFAGYGGNIGLTFQSLPYDTDFKKIKKGIFFISNPSSRNGNILSNEYIASVGDAGHEIILDVAYVGLTASHRFITDHPAIIAIVGSLSKPFGLYYYRVGFAFMKYELKTLMVNKWFKNVLSLIIGKKILETLQSSQLYTTYLPLQEKAIADFNKQSSLSTKKSDAILLSYLDKKDMPTELAQHYQLYERKSYYRFCLTPYYYSYEKNPTA